MPRATVSHSTDRLELTTLEGAFVELKRMSYGKWLERQELGMEMKISGGNKGGGMAGDIKMMNRLVTEFEFRECLVDHNLTDDGDEPIDFRKPGALMKLDPRVGNEIATWIREAHEFDLEK